MSWERKCFRSVCLKHFHLAVFFKKKFTFWKPFWFCTGSEKQRKTILCYVPVWLMNTVISCRHLWDTMNKQLIRTLTVRRISCQQFLLQPSDYHTSLCVQEHKKLEVMKGRQTKSALIAAKSAIFGERIKIKNGCLRSQCTHWWAFDKKAAVQTYWR